MLGIHSYNGSNRCLTKEVRIYVEEGHKLLLMVA